jgi:hypothetical protein
MRKFLLSALALSAVAVSAPAAAQHNGNYRQGGAGIERQLDQIEQQIDRLRDRRLISGGEANRLQRQAEQIDRLHDRFRRNGLTQREHFELTQRIQNLRSQLRYERREGREDRRDRRW